MTAKLPIKRQPSPDVSLVQSTMRIPSDLHDKLTRLAYETDRSLQQVVTRALQDIVNQTRSTHPTHKQRCDYATQDYTVVPVLQNSIAILIAHAMSEPTEQPENFLEVLTQLAFTYSLDRNITPRESRRAQAMCDALRRAKL